METILDLVRGGDTIVFDSVFRMSRNADKGIDLYMESYRQNISFVFLKEPHINTDTYKADIEKRQIAKTGDEVDLILKGVERYLIALVKRQSRQAFEHSEKEVSDLHQRTREGIETARRNGKQVGQQRGRKLNVKKANAAKNIIRQHSYTFGGSLDDKECMKLAEGSRTSFY